MAFSASASTIAATWRHRRIALGVLAALSVIEFVVLAAQFDVGRFVYAQPLRGPGIFSAAVMTIPLLLGSMLLVASRVTDPPSGALARSHYASSWSSHFRSSM